LADIPFHSAGPQHWPGHAQCDAVLVRDCAHALGALDPNTVGREQFFVFIDLWGDEIYKLLHIAFEPVIGLVLTAANSKRMRSQARAAVLLENLENFFAVAEGVEERRDRADIQSMRAQPKLVAGNSIQLRENDSNVFCARWRLHIEQLLDRLAVTQSIGNR